MSENRILMGSQHNHSLEWQTVLISVLQIYIRNTLCINVSNRTNLAYDQESQDEGEIYIVLSNVLDLHRHSLNEGKLSNRVFEEGYDLSSVLGE